MSCNEKNFIKRLQKKKEDGLEYVIDHYLAMVKGTVVKVLGPLGESGAVEECVNDVFLAIWENSQQFDGSVEDFRKWVYTVARYQAIDHYRKLKRHPLCALPEEWTEQVPSAEEELLQHEAAEDVAALLETLPPTDRQIFMMKYLLGVKPEEIASCLGISRSAVDNRVYRGKKKLGQTLRHQMGGGLL